MFTEDLAESFRVLVRGRGRAVGSELGVLAREHANSSSGELAEALSSAPRRDKAAIGLLLARVSLEDAMQSHSREAEQKFLFRFGAHLKASVSEPGLAAAERLCLALAAEKVFEELPSASAAQRADAHRIAVRLAGPDVTERHWRGQLGVSYAEFAGVIEKAGAELRVTSRLHRTPGAPARRPERTARQQSASVRASKNLHPLPGWLVVPARSAEEADTLVAATANWLPLSESSSPSDIQAAWSAFREGEYLSARSAITGLLATVGLQWGPETSVDALRFWNWLRLICELAALEAGEARDRRRSWISVVTLASSCLPEEDDLIEAWLSQALDDFAAGDPTTTQAWCAYSARAIAAVGHEAALASYTNSEKASLRAAWADHFGLTSDEARNTSSMTAEVVPRLKEVIQRIHLSARKGSPAYGAIREIEKTLRMFLDQGELELLGQILEIADEGGRLASSDATNHRDITEHTSSLRSLHAAVAVSGSALLQDVAAPQIQVMLDAAARSRARLGDISRPSVSVRLASAKLPFSAVQGSPFEIGFVVQNVGNAAAENILLQITQPELGIETSAQIDVLGAGAERTISAEACGVGESPKAVSLSCHVSWSDALLQPFTTLVQLAAEDQMPAAWSPQDINPFNLGTISDPARLVGRDGDLAALDALVAGNASAYVTGQKRVGKTSLVRVLLKSLRDSRGWAAGLLPLGRALGPDQTADDLVYALLDEIDSAARAAYPALMGGVQEVITAEPGSFARAAHRWLKSMSRVLPDGSRVVVGIDDFDELPQHLVNGPQADSLFLFLRSLVDEPWLNLIFVGSEVLPTIVQAQAHKLNQVVPVSVTNFQSRESTAELVEAPTADRLEWVPESVDRMHFLCRGNPYYETLLAQRLWSVMRDRGRSVVTPGDVEEAALGVARDAPDSHFVHLWADGASGMGHTSRSAVVASAILRSVARCGGEELAPADPDEVVRIAATWIQTATTAELKSTIATLRSREVVTAGPSDGSLLIGIPLVSTWLLEAGGRALDALYATSKYATATARMITDLDLVKLSRRLIYSGEHVTEIRIRAWLEQFGDNYHQFLAFRVLRRMVLEGYYTSSKLQNTILPRLATNASNLAAARLLVREANNQYLKNAYLIDHGVPGDSTQGTVSALVKALKIKKANVVEIGSLSEKVRHAGSGVVLYLLDDFCGSGTHLRNELAHLVDALVALGEEWVERTNIVVGAAVMADRADLSAESYPVSVEVVEGVALGERHRAFSPSSEIFDGEKERLDAEEMFSSIGSALLPSHPLGYGGGGLLTLFEFNCPNNVPPVFWKAGTVSSSKWIPLFERMV